MDKDRRIRRYRRKDYTEMVEFPVEIVGRDGQVRRYDFEESIRLYQRRMHFAPMRFADEDVVAAEQGHCRARIEQLRRSYFHLYGWGGEGPEVTDVEHAGELVSLLLRAFRVRERLDVRFSRLGGDARSGELWFMERPSPAASFLLYAYHFDGPDGEAAQLAFAARLRELRGTGDCGGDAERLVIWRHANDCGFVVTGRGEDVSTIAALAPGDDGELGLEPTPWDEAVSFVRRGDLPTAFLRCRWLVEEQPWHRDAYALGAALALTLRRALDAEDLALVGSCYAKNDPLLFYYGGLARLHQGRRPEAMELLLAAASGSRPLQPAISALGWAHLAQGNLVAALRTLQSAGPVRDSADATLRRELLLEARWLALVVALGGLVLGVSLFLLVSGRTVPPVVPLAGLIFVGLWVWRARRVLRELGLRVRYEDPEQVLRRVEASRA